MPSNVFSTIGQLVKYFVHLKDKPNSVNSAVINKIAKDVVALWNKASLPTVEHRTVVNRVHKIISKGSQLKRSKTSSVMQKQFTSTFCKLFDICSCNCKVTMNTTLGKVVSQCSCSRDVKVASRELTFLQDQRTTRQMYIGGVDSEVTTKLRNIERRKSDEQVRKGKIEQSTSNKQPAESMIITRDSDSDEENPGEIKHDEEVIVSSDDIHTVSSSEDSDSEISEYESTNQMRLPLPNLVKEADRFGISDRATAALATALLVDFGIITNEDRSSIIDKNKIRRERKKMREKLRIRSKKNETMNGITSVYFDGRKDETLIRKKENGKWYTHISKEDHYVLVSEPESMYMGHVSPKGSKSQDIAESIILKMQEMGIESTVRVVGCDSTNINTGYKGGIIQYIENAVGHSLLWCICLLHTNELLSRHLFQTLDGPKTGDKTLYDSIEKLLQSCEQMPVVQFKPIAVGEGLPEIQHENLSTDQKYLYEIVQSIREGSITNDLAHRKPGHLHHSRWLTLANRVCRLYVATEKPTKNLQLITHFIVTHYSVNWFLIKCKPLISDGPKHVYQAVQLLKYLPSAVVDIVKPYILRNAYYAHPEHMLLALLTDTDKNNRDKAVQIILQIRENSPKSHSQIRKFQVPDINLNPQTWVHLINWDSTTMTEPPLVSHLTNEQLLEIIDKPLIVPHYPNHTQSVERCVKLVTDASRTVYGSNSRDGFIRAKITSRTVMPQFDTKKQFAKSSE